jgi:hypothetical protein
VSRKCHALDEAFNKFVLGVVGDLDCEHVSAKLAGLDLNGRRSAAGLLWVEVFALAKAKDQEAKIAAVGQGNRANRGAGFAPVNE